MPTHTPPRNLATLAHEDTFASNGKWTSRTTSDNVREIRHYGTLMMTIRLSDSGHPKKVTYERPGGSMSDKCGLSRIRQTIPWAI